MASVFDQFDSSPLEFSAPAAAPPSTGAGGGGVFDQFDTNAPPPPTGNSETYGGQPTTPGAFGNNPMAARRSMSRQQQTGYTPSSVPFLDPIAAGADQAIESLPVVGGPMISGVHALDAAANNALAPVFGWQQETPDQRAAIDASTRAQYPVATGAGAVVGTVAPFMALGSTELGAKLLGSGGGGLPTLLGRTGASIAANGGISYLDSLSRGQSQEQSAKNAALSAGVGAFLPGASDAVGWALGQTVKPVASTIGGLVAPGRASESLIGNAYARDAASGVPMMSDADAALAIARGQPVVAADLGGQNVRTLARTAANVDPSAKAVLDDTVQSRFQSQGPRAVNFINQLMGGQVNDVAYQQSLRDAAKAANKPAYDAAYADPAAQSIWTPEIQQMMQAPDFQAAVKGATRTAANDAVLNGAPPIKNPFNVGEDGTVALNRNADGSIPLPSLQYWDIVQRNLRNMAESAAGNDNLGASQAKGLRTMLLNTLDTAVPTFQTARQGAAAAFGAQDALDAGRNFANQPKAIPEMTSAYTQFNPAQRDAFATGYASSLIDNLKAAGDRTNAINRYFGSPASREMAQLALGPDRASQLESYVRSEDIMDRLRTAVGGNSTTAQQLIAAGLLGGGVSGYESNWNPMSMATGAGIAAAGRRGLAEMAGAVDRGVLSDVAKKLTSNDPQMFSRLVQQGARHTKYMQALRAIQNGLRAAVPAAVDEISDNRNQ